MRPNPDADKINIDIRVENQEIKAISVNQKEIGLDQLCVSVNGKKIHSTISQSVLRLDE